MINKNEKYRIGQSFQGFSAAWDCWKRMLKLAWKSTDFRNRTDPYDFEHDRRHQTLRVLQACNLQQHELVRAIHAIDALTAFKRWFEAEIGNLRVKCA